MGLQPKVYTDENITAIREVLEGQQNSSVKAIMSLNIKVFGTEEQKLRLQE
jgi:hypothetical protein